MLLYFKQCLYCGWEGLGSAAVEEDGPEEGIFTQTDTCGCGATTVKYVTIMTTVSPPPDGFVPSKHYLQDMGKE